MPARSAEDGTGVELVKACVALRLTFSHLTEAIQESVRKASKPPPPPAAPPPAQVSAWKPCPDMSASFACLVDSLSPKPACMAGLCLKLIASGWTAWRGGSYQAP